jgi:hypothetical protein
VVRLDGERGAVVGGCPGALRNWPSRVGTDVLRLRRLARISSGLTLITDDALGVVHGVDGTREGYQGGGVFSLKALER